MIIIKNFHKDKIPKLNYLKKKSKKKWMKNLKNKNSRMKMSPVLHKVYQVIAKSKENLWLEYKQQIFKKLLMKSLNIVVPNLKILIE